MLSRIYHFGNNISFVRTIVNANFTVSDKERFRLPVEKNVNKLVNYLCGSDITENGEPVKIKDDSEYPDWIWEIKISEPLTENDFDYDSKEYWQFLELQHSIRLAKLQKCQPKETMIMNEMIKLKRELLDRHKTRLLPPDNLDPGWDPKDITDEMSDPRVYLKPDENDQVIYLDKVVPSKSFSNDQFYKDLVKTRYKSTPKRIV